MIERLGGLVRLGVGLGLAGAGLAGGLAAEHALARRIRTEPEPSGDAVIGVGAASERVVVTDDGARLRLFEQGSGRPIVLLHGITLAAQVWQHQLDELAAAGYRVVAFDQRGHGESTIGTAGLGFDRLASDVVAVLTELDLHDVVLVGHSMGGMVAMRLLTGPAASGPALARVSALGLVSTTSSSVRDRGIPGLGAVLGVSRPLARPTNFVASRLPGASLPGSDLGLLATRLAFGEHPSPSQVALTQQIVASVPARVTGPLTVEIFNFDATADLAALDLPTTVVVGSNDIFTPFRQAEVLAGAIAGAELAVIDGCGHMVMLEGHAELSRVIAELARRSVGQQRAGSVGAG